MGHVQRGNLQRQAITRRAGTRFGFRFRTHCDTEIIPAGYLAWGDTLFDRLEGMFAIAIWDTKERRLVLARDAIGIKPLFYSVDRSTVRFGSEIKSLLADPDQSCDLDPEVVHRFLALGHVGPTECMVRGIRQVPPGTIVSFCAGDVRADTFWRPGRKPVLRNLDEAVDAFMPIWDRVIGDQLVSDVPLGVLQSGGIDSCLCRMLSPARVNFPCSRRRLTTHLTMRRGRPLRSRNGPDCRTSPYRSTPIRTRRGRSPT